METSNFSETNIESGNNNEEDNGQLEPEKTTKIVFDYDQLNYLKFRLTFSDGFLFGLGLCAAGIFISLLIFLVLTLVGVSLFIPFINR